MESPQKIATVKIDQNLCIGSGLCMAIHPNVFALDGQNKSVMLCKEGSRCDTTSVSEFNAAEADENTLRLAAQSCPTRAISLYDENGEQL